MRRRHRLRVHLGFLVLFCLIIFAVLPAVGLPLARSPPGHPAIVVRQTGNPVAAGDLYGLAIRIGTYLQVLGMLLSCARSNATSGVGIKLSASIIIIALLSSWTVLVRGQEISPCETWLVITLTASFTVPLGMALFNRHTIIGEGIGIFFVVISLLWLGISTTRFWANLYLELPISGTHNLVFFFTAVDVTGWFRIVMFVVCALSCVVHIAWGLWAFVPMIWVAIKAWLEGKTEGEAEISEQPCFRKYAPWLRRCQFTLGAFAWILTIVGAEKIIEYNHLVPNSDLSQPGQAIPLIVGSIIALDGFSTVFRPKAHPDY
jgi:hypothetical protein